MLCTTQFEHSNVTVCEVGFSGTQEQFSSTPFLISAITRIRDSKNLWKKVKQSASMSQSLYTTQYCIKIHTVITMQSL